MIHPGWLLVASPRISGHSGADRDLHDRVQLHQPADRGAAAEPGGQVVAGRGRVGPRHAAAGVAEAHPELSFAGLAGAPLRSRKSTWAGAAERRALLARAGIVLADDLGPPAEQAGVDDVLDAAVMAWTAQRLG